MVFSHRRPSSLENVPYASSNSQTAVARSVLGEARLRQDADEPDARLAPSPAPLLVVPPAPPRKGPAARAKAREDGVTRDDDARRRRRRTPRGIIHRRSVFEVRGHVVGRRIARGAALFLRFPRRVFFVFVVFAATAVAAAVLVSMMAVLVVVVVVMMVVLPAVVLPVGMAFRRRVEGFRRRVRFRRVRHTIFVGVVAPSAMALGARRARSAALAASAARSAARAAATGVRGSWSGEGGTTSERAAGARRASSSARAGTGRSAETRARNPRVAIRLALAAPAGEFVVVVVVCWVVWVVLTPATSDGSRWFAAGPRARSSSGLACERRSRSVSQRGGGVPWTATEPGAPRRANGVGGRARARFGAAHARAIDWRGLGATGLSAEAALARFICRRGLSRYRPVCLFDERRTRRAWGPRARELDARSVPRARGPRPGRRAEPTRIAVGGGDARKDVGESRGGEHRARSRALDVETGCAERE